MRVFSVLLLSVLTLMASPAAGQESISVPHADVEGLVRTALERSPDLAALREKAAGAGEMVRLAGALPDPMLDMMIQNVGWDRWTVGKEEMSMVSVSVRQSLPYPGKRAASREAARAEAAMADAEIAQTMRRIALEVRTLSASLYSLDNEAASLEASKELLDLLSATAADRYASGQAEQEAVVKARLEILNLENRRDDLAAERRKIVAGLNRLMDAPPEQPVGSMRTLPDLPLPAASWTDLAEANSSDVSVKVAEELASRKRLDRVKLDLRPDFGAVGGIGLRGGGLDTVMTLGVSMELPFWKKEKQQPMIRAAEHDVERTALELKAAKADVRASASRLKADFDRLDLQIRRLSGGIIPTTSEAMSAALASYIAGKGDFSTVIEDFRAWLDARVELARRSGDRYSVLAELDSLIAPPLDAAESR